MNMTGQRFITIIFVSFFLLIAAFSFVLALFYFNSPPSTVAENEKILFEIQSGETAANVGRRLQAAGRLRSIFFWRALVRFDALTNKAGTIKSGSFLLPPNLSALQLLAFFKEGKEQLFALTVPEGYTLGKIALLLDGQGITSEKEFLDVARDKRLLDAYNIPRDSFEGYLFPDTYFFPAACSPEKIIETMHQNFLDKLQEVCSNSGVEFSALSAEELAEKITLASIVEREYRRADEAALIAGVFYNRLERGMRPESCATVEYIITELYGKPHPDRIFTADTKIDNPYNTYANRGLPPGPIAAPGLVALNAVFAPERSRYLFFRVIDADAGRHHFSETFDEHSAAGGAFTGGTVAAFTKR
jgi:UPF0755 protein